MSSATSNYIAHSEPTREPVVFSDTTRQNFRRVHNISGQAVTVTSKTTEMINKVVEKLADQITGHSSSSSSTPALPSRNRDGLPPSKFSSSYPGPSSPQSASHTPPLPPRKKPTMLNHMLASTDLLLITIDNLVQHLISNGTQNVSVFWSTNTGPTPPKRQYKWASRSRTLARFISTPGELVAVLCSERQGRGSCSAVNFKDLCNLRAT